MIDKGAVLPTHTPSKPNNIVEDAVMPITIYTVPTEWQQKIWETPNALFSCTEEEKWEMIMFELFEPSMLGEGNPFYGKTHTEEWKRNKSNQTKGENNPMYGTKRGKECSNGGLYGKQNGMYGTKRGKECVNKRMTCPLCGIESNSSNIKVHITKTHKKDWKECLNQHY